MDIYKKIGRTIKTVLSAMLAAAMLITCTGSFAETVVGGDCEIVLSTFIDENNNGNRGKYELPLADVRFGAYKVDGDNMTLVAEATADKDGIARITVPSGTYHICAELPYNCGFSKQGGVDSKNNNIFDYTTDSTAYSREITVKGGKNEFGVGTIKYSFVEGTCFNDVNANGIWEEDEPGLAGVLVEIISRRNGNVISSAISDENGYYRVEKVLPETYNLRATLPDGMMFAKYSKEGRDRRSIITTSGVSAGIKEAIVIKKSGTKDQNIGASASAGVTVQCFGDSNGNGIMDDGETGAAGITLEVFKTNGKSVAVLVSDENGTVNFGSLRDGEYNIRASLPESFVYTVEAENGNRFYAPAGRKEATVKNVSVTFPQKDNLYLGIVKMSTVSGTAYTDDNYSGSMDNGEKPAAGISVKLCNDSGVAATVKTNSKGEYYFENVYPGKYYITAVPMQGYAFTKKGEGSIIENISLSEGKSDAFDIIMGSNVTGMNMGMLKPATVEGTVFADDNDNGVKDNGEAGFKGTAVSLMDENGVVFTKTVGDDGAFTFDTVMPGTYFIRYQLPGDSVFVKPMENSVEEGCGDTAEFTLSFGEVYNADMCGGVPLYHLTGIIFEDENGDGIVNEDDYAVSDVETHLKLGEKEYVSTTDAFGRFTYSSLRPGNYEMQLDIPDGKVFTRKTNATLPVEERKGSQTISVTFGRDSSYGEQYLGISSTSSIEGVMWMDENNNGWMDEGEYNPENEKMLLVDNYSGEVCSEITTLADGQFAAKDILPGNYSLVYTLDRETEAATAGDSTFSVKSNMKIGEDVSDALVMEDINLIAGADMDQVYLGIKRTGSISGKAWRDSMGEIIPINGAIITLHGVSIDDGSNFDDKTYVTEENGEYRFTDLPAGKFTVSAVVPDGQTYVEADDVRLSSSGNSSIITSAKGNIGNSSDISLRMGQRLTSQDIGTVQAGAIGDCVWLDVNGNGLQDGDEYGVPGVTLSLYRTDKPDVVATYVTDATGYYEFNNLYPASYIIKAEYPLSVKPTVVRKINLISSIMQDNGETDVITVASGTKKYDADIGFTLTTPGDFPDNYGEFPTQDWTPHGYPDKK